MPLERFPRLASIGLLGIALTACQPALRPTTAPSPVSSAPALRATNSRPSERPVAAPAAVGAAVASASRGDAVMRTATSVFGDSASFDGVRDESADAAPTWDIDVRSYETHERVEHYLRLFSGSARERMSERISRGTRYESMIRSKMRANGMPEDLFYLALIESGYDPNAYSKAAAVGMWQFMTATGRGVGLRIDWWMDERRDPARSTDAAITFLQSLQKQFGSLYLAAAAYNGGPGRVARGLSRFADEIGDAEGDDKFFALAEQDYLHSETKNYVPQLIAAALVAKSPEKFGLVIEPQPEYAYDSLLVEAGTSLGAVARTANIPIEQISDLNPAILRGATPPDKSVWLRVPVGLGDSATLAYGHLPSDERLAWTTVTPKKGESITALAKRHEVSRTEITAFNPGLRTLKSGVISAGQKVRVPRRDALLAARSVPDPVIERYGGSAAGVHVVKAGESLGGIGRKYGLTVTRLKSLNGLRSDRIRPGQALVVRAGSSASSTRMASASAPTRSAAKAKAAATKAKSGGTTTHVVRSGESLGGIAQRYKTTVSRIKTLNKLSGDRIKAGQKLVVRRS